MISNLFFSVLADFLNWLTGMFTVPTSCALSGMADMGTMLNKIVATTAVMFPWTDIFAMVGILLVISGIRITMQIVKFIRGS